MLESATAYVSSTTSAIAGSLTTLWSTSVATIGTIPSVLLAAAVVVGAVVCVKWLWTKAKAAWKNRGVQATQTQAPATA